MELTIKIPFSDLLNMVHKLTPAQRAKLQYELSHIKGRNGSSKTRLKEMLLKGPTITEAQIKTFEQSRKEINQWRIKF